MKKSRLVEFLYSNTIQKAGTPELMVYKCRFENMDSGSAFLLAHEVLQINLYSEYSYDITSSGNIKFRELSLNTNIPTSPVPNQRQSSAPTQQAPANYANQNQNKVEKKNNYTAKETDYLGFSASYAKDLVIAGKTKPQDIKDFKKILTEVYNHIKELQKGNIPNEDKIEAKE